MEHPDILSAYRTGYAAGAKVENEDCPEARLEFAKDNPDDFLEFVLGYDRTILDDYINNRGWQYQCWLN